MAITDPSRFGNGYASLSLPSIMLSCTVRANDTPCEDSVTGKALNQAYRYVDCLYNGALAAD